MWSCSAELAFVLLFLPIFVHCKSYYRSLTAMIDAGMEDCYYMPNVTKGQKIDIDFQVVNTGSQTGQMDISARLLNPNRETMEAFERQSEGTFSQEADGDGDFAACFDNTYSTFSSKHVFVELSVADSALGNAHYEYDDDYIASEEMQEMRALDANSEDAFRMTVEEIKSSLQRIRMNVARAQHDQDLFSVVYSKDMHNVVNTMSKVNLWALVQLTLVLFTGFLQVFMVKGLFDEKYSFKKYVYRN